MDTYLIVRVHGMSTKLLPENTLLQMAYAKSLKDIVSLLSITEYRELIDKSREISAEALHEVYRSIFLRRLITLINMASGIHRDFLVEYARIFEIENILYILKKLVAGEKVDPSRLIAIPYSPIDYKSLSEARSLENALKILKATQTYSDIRDVAINKAVQYRSVFPVEAELNRIRYENLFKMLNNLAFLTVKDELKMLFGTEIDIYNIFAITASVIYKFAQDLVQHSIISIDGYLIPYNKVRKALKVPRSSELLNIFKAYENVIENIIKEQEVEAYIIIQKEIKRRILSRKIQKFTSFYDVILYLKKAEYEFRNLSMLTHAVQYNIPGEIIQQQLIL